MRLEEFDEVLTQEERERIASEVVAEMFPNLPKRKRDKDEN
ncbi:hypothetical protein [Jeotgalibaca porci]